MKRVWTILRREYMERVRQRSFLIGTLLGPVFILGVTILPILIARRTTDKPVAVIVVDQSSRFRGKLESALPDTLADGTRRFRFEWRDAPPALDVVAAEERLQKEILAEQRHGYIWLPPDVISGGDAKLFAFKLADPEVDGRLRDALSRAAMMVRLEDAGIDPQETSAISRRVGLKVFKLSEQGVREGSFERDYMGALLFSMILYMTILLYGVGVQRSVLEDKSSRIIEVMLSSARPFHILLGKVVGVGGVGLTQYAIWGVVALAASAYIRTTSPALANFTAIPGGTLVFFALFFLLGYLLYAAIYAALGAMVNTDQEAQQLQWPVTMLLVIPLILMQQLFRDPDGTGSVVLSLIPFFSPILMMLRINISTPPAWQIGLSLILLVLTILATTAIAARIFRIGILMYGKRPTLPELLRWVREG